MSELMTDVGNGRRLVDHYGDRLLYVRGHGWLVWNRRVWANDEALLMQFAKQTATTIWGEAQAETDIETKRALARHALKTESRSGLTNMVWAAESEAEVQCEPHELDADPLLLSVQNGTLDLRMGRLRPHRPEDRITTLSPATWRQEASCPAWRKFLAEITDGKADLEAFLQRMVGYSITGLAHEQVLFVLYGLGANGKSRFLEVILELLGEAGRTTPADTLLNRRDGGIPNDLARLRNCRLTVASEPNEGRHLDEGRIKALTGGEPIVARFLNREFFEFTPRFKLWLATNHRPQVRGTDHAVWRRIRLVPFMVTIPEERRDKQLGDKLRMELDGILAWAVEGCLAWQREGLAEPEIVLGATREYRAEEDVLAGFLSDRCDLGTGYWASSAALFTAYKMWCRDYSEEPISRKVFGQSLKERGLDPTNDRVPGRPRTRGYAGIRLRVEGTAGAGFDEEETDFGTQERNGTRFP